MLLLGAFATLLSACSAPSSGGDGSDLGRVRPAQPHRVTDLPAAVRLSRIERHLDAFAAIAQKHDHTRAAGTAGYEASRDYVVRTLRAAGYRPRVQPFEVSSSWEEEPSRLQASGAGSPSFAHDEDFATLSFSGSGDADGEVVAAGGARPGDVAGAGCAKGDYADFPASGTQVVVVGRGSCTFRHKVQLAEQAGAEAVLVANDDAASGDLPVSGTLVTPVDIPVLGVSRNAAMQLMGAGRVRVITRTHHETETTWNVIAETGGGDARHVVMVGGHLDSVGAGPGIVDNATGAAAVLTVAEALAGATNLTQRVRFAWWGGEEEGLFGSRHYLADLGTRDPTELADLVAYLNLDMIGSSNFVRLVYGGAGAIGGLPTAQARASARVARPLTSWFRSHELASQQLPFDERSDYEPFLRVGVPTAALYSGADGVKSPAEAKRYGGVAGRIYEPCYHQACDDRDQVNSKVLDQMSDALAHAVQVLALGPEWDRGAAATRKRGAAEVRAEARSGWNAVR